MGKSKIYFSILKCGEYLQEVWDILNGKKFILVEVHTLQTKEHVIFKRNSNHIRSLEQVYGK